MSLLKLYLLSNFLYKKKLIRLSKIIDILNKKINKCVVYGSTSIGKNTVFAYSGIAVVIHKKAIIGENCMIGQCVTIGATEGAGNIKEIPTLKNNVYVGAGAKIIGNITIGENTIIAPNAVVNKDVQPYSVVGGVPAKLITQVNEQNFHEKYKYYGLNGYLNEE